MKTFVILQALFILTCLIVNTEAEISLTVVGPFSESTINGINISKDFECNSEVTLVCEVKPYIDSVIWEINGHRYALCIFQDCLTYPPFPENHNFAMDLESEVFNLTVTSVSNSTNNNIYKCDNGITARSVEATVNVYPTNETLKMDETADDRITVTTGCVYPNGINDVIFEWFITKTNMTLDPEPFTTKRNEITEVFACTETQSCVVEETSHFNNTVVFDVLDTGEEYYIYVTIKHNDAPNRPSAVYSTERRYKVKGKDCGTLPTLSSGRYVLVGPSTTFGASARVICDTGYTADKSSVTCQSTGIWESAVCNLIDCGTLPGVANGNVTLDNVNKTMFAATASVACDQGYRPVQVSITCQASGKWDTPLCKTAGNSTPPYGGPKDDKPSVNLVLLVVLVVLGVLLLVQLAIMCYLQCKIHNIRKTAKGGDTAILKRIGMTILGSVPVMGVIPIYMTWRVFYKDVYIVSHGKHSQETKNGKVAFSNSSYSDVTMNENGTNQKEVHVVEETGVELVPNETDIYLRTNNSHTEENTGEQTQSSTIPAASSSEHNGKED